MSPVAGCAPWCYHKRVFDLVKDFGTSESPKSTRSSTTHWCPGRPGHPAFRHNIASSLRLHTGLPYDWTPRSDAPLGSPLAPSARRVSRVASRLPGTTRLRFALHGGQRKILGHPSPQNRLDLRQLIGAPDVLVTRRSATTSQARCGYTPASHMTGHRVRMLPWDPLWRLRHVGYPVSPRGYRGLPAFASLSMAGSDGITRLRGITGVAEQVHEYLGEPLGVALETDPGLALQDK